MKSPRSGTIDVFIACTQSSGNEVFARVTTCGMPFPRAYGQDVDLTGFICSQFEMIREGKGRARPMIRVRCASEHVPDGVRKSIIELRTDWG